MIHPLGNTKLRTAESFASYADSPKKDGCFICDAPALREFPYWKVITNDFPYDAVATKHVLLVPLRHVKTDVNFTPEEWAALDVIRHALNKEHEYDAVLENLARGRTVPGHFHYHLMQWIRV